MANRPETLTFTLAWRSGDHEQQDIVTCDDSPPATLLPLLLSGCNLAPQAGGYQLRVDSAHGPRLDPALPLSAQQVRNGSRLWLAPAGLQHDERTALECVLHLPDGSSVLLPPAGQQLGRAWLLHVLKLYNPAGHALEVQRFAQQRSAYRFVSNHAHCLVERSERGYWLVTTGRADRETAVNDQRLVVQTPECLENGARLRLGGKAGVELLVRLI